MSDKLTNICFLTSSEQKKMLKRWAKETDRTISSILRVLISQEAERREVEAQQEKQTTGHFEDL